MTTSIDLTPAEIRKEGWEALISQLGVAKSLRFLLSTRKPRETTPNLERNCLRGRQSMT